ncbi:AraC-like DNA-binding protein [Pedobacter sp. UYP24]
MDFFWMCQNDDDQEREVVVLPDGRIDVAFGYAANEPFNTLLMGLGNEPLVSMLPPHSLTFAISFKLLGAEYILPNSVATYVNKATLLQNGFWGISKNDLKDFESFCKKASEKMIGLISKKVDERKLLLFRHIYDTNGAITVNELSEKVHWSSLQINRYFQRQFGISLKSYCNILRFRASFPHLKVGKLYPEQNYTDQAHFIKEVKKFAGVVPKELSKNKNDQFVNFTTFPNLDN